MTTPSIIDTKIEAIIVDDETKAGILLKSMLEELTPQVNVSHIFQDPRLALTAVEEKSPDLLFLDIQMPHLNGFELLESCSKRDFNVIFVTGYDEYAIDAFKISASDYIMKPISDDSLIQAVGKVVDQVHYKHVKTHYEILLDNLQANHHQQKKIGIPTVNGIDFVRLDKIIACEGQKRYTKVIMSEGEHVFSSYNVGEFAKILEKCGFFLAHRSYLINLSKIKQYQKDGSIILENNMAIPLARRRKDEFLEKITTL